MSFIIKHVVGGPLKTLTGGLEEEEIEGEKSEGAAKGRTEEEYEAIQQQIVDEKKEREVNFAQKKAERAAVRTHFRDKYRLTQNDLDVAQIQEGGEVQLPTDLAKMIAEDNREEEHKQSIIGQLSNIQNMDLDELKDKAQASIEDLKQCAEKCSVM
ncbi:complexin-3-like [Brienomyrus brachyistius]|uniref:complexin-3-like n=1 Tax=Brienomyrus brachyistius TaxID=42636 RepID=UPI0020B19C93|nr:complexin-3-like [Brienomyrus brachyistius]